MNMKENCRINNNRFLKIMVISLLFFIWFTVTAAFSQDISNPNDGIYKLLTQWENKGYINNLPLLRPYPRFLIVKSLETVIKSGNQQAKRTAKRVLKNITQQGIQYTPNSPAGISFKPENQIEYRTGEAEPYYRFGFDTLFSVGRTNEKGDSLTIDGKYGAFLIDRGTGNFAPLWTNVEQDYQSGGGSITIGKKTIPVDQFWSSLVAFGKPNIFIQAGIVRSSFGPFFEGGTIIGNTAPQAAHFSFSLRSDRISYTELLLELVAKYGVHTDGSIYLLKDAVKNSTSSAGYPGKYLALQFLEISPFPWARLGLIQSVIWGERFSPVYLIPAQALLYSQVFAGDYDNSLMGITGILGPFAGASIRFAMYIDDWNFNEILKFNLNSDQNKFALQAGVLYTPSIGFLNRIDLNYLMITRYMYTHSSFQPINYLTYTHNGKQLGSELPPNSDRLSLTAEIEPIVLTGDIFPGLRNLSINFLLHYIRHGEGSVFDDGYDENGNVTFYGPSTFLKGNVRRIFQGSINLNLRLNFSLMDVIFTGGYTYQNELNVTDGIRNFFNTGLTLRIE